MDEYSVTILTYKCYICKTNSSTVRKQDRVSSAKTSFGFEILSKPGISLKCIFLTTLILIALSPSHDGILKFLAFLEPKFHFSSRQLQHYIVKEFVLQRNLGYTKSYTCKVWLERKETKLFSNFDSCGFSLFKLTSESQKNWIKLNS